MVLVACQIEPQLCTVDDILEGAHQAEAAGVDVVYVWDHMFPLYGHPDGASFECYTLLGAIARETTRVRIGALVAANRYRNPDLHAYMVGTLDHLSGGRALLGIGAGWALRDFEEFGYEYGTVAERLRELGRDLPRIKRRLARLSPLPPGPVPILIGGDGERVTLRLVARHADIWHAFGDAERWGAKSRVLDRWCAEEGRDPAAVQRSASVAPEDLGGARELIAAGAQMLTVEVGVPFDFGRLGPLVELAHGT
jgi:probable F420-dependent oxidoreductase